MLCSKSDEMGKYGDLLFITRQGQMKRTASSEYGIRRARFAAINLKGDDQVAAMCPIAQDDKGEILIATRAGFALRFKLSEIPVNGRATAGVKGIDVTENDEVFRVMLPKMGDMLLVVSDRGFGKRMMADDVDRQKRATKGQKLLPITKTGEIGTGIAVLCSVANAESVTFTQKHGHVTTMQMFEIPVDRRTGKGTLLVSVLLDDVVEDADVTERKA